MGKIKDTDLLLINRGGVDYNSPVEELSIPKKTSELDNDSNFITLADVPPAPEGGIPEAPTDGEQYARKGGTWAVVEIPEGFSGDYNDLTNQPTIPTDNAQLANGAGYITAGDIPEVNLDPYAKLNDASQSITAQEFIGDGSKLTGIDVGGAVGISEVLAEGNTADPAQSLHFNISGGDLPPIRTVDTIDFDGSAGLRLGGLVSYYHINEPFTVDTGSGDVSEFEYATRQMSTMEDAYFTTNSEGDVFTQVGLWGIRYRDKGTEVNINDNNIQLKVKDKDDPDNYIFNIDVGAFGGTSSIKAGEFIGDGSKLTNLPAAAVGINEVLTEGNEADFGQKLIFHTTADDVVPPYTLPSGVDIPDFEVEANYGTFIRGAHTRYQASEPFNYVDGDVDVQVNWAVADASPTGYVIRGNRVDKSGELEYNGSINKFGLHYSAFNSTTNDISSYSFNTDLYANLIYGGASKFLLDVGEGGASLEIDGSITATEFIGDGSKLTNLPAAPTVDQLPVLPD